MHRLWYLKLHSYGVVHVILGHTLGYITDQQFHH